MTEKKPGLLKRIFSFGFGRKEQEAEPETVQESGAQEALADEAAPAETTAPPQEPAPRAKTGPEPEMPAPVSGRTKAEKPGSDKPKSDKPKSGKQKTGKQKTGKPSPAAEPSPAAKPSPATGKAARAPEPAPSAEPPAKPISGQPQQPEAIAPEPEAPETAGTQAAEQEAGSGENRITLTERRQRAQPAPESSPGESAEDAGERRTGWLKRLAGGLTRSSSALKENISGVFTNRKLDDGTLQELEDILIQADLGVETAMRITDALSDRKFGKEISGDEVREVMAGEIEKILEPVAVDLDLDLAHQPHVILVVGVNGSGKTTTIGKLASKLYDAGFSTTLVAGDTFRAAAIEQLKIWGERTRSPVISREIGSDAAGLVYDAWQQAREERRDVLLIDTAGRLQNRTELMAELEKIVRVLKKQDPTAPHTVLLTLDATTGQNAMNQVEIFTQVSGVNGLVMTKLDGTARGGILVAIAARHKLPVYFVGVGEQVADLEPFEARDFARSIAGLPQED